MFLEKLFGWFGEKGEALFSLVVGLVILSWFVAGGISIFIHDGGLLMAVLVIESALAILSIIIVVFVTCITMVVGSLLALATGRGKEFRM